MARTDYARATRTLRERIERGVYQPGERLPSERDLAQSLGMARHTMRQAIADLTEAGLISSNGAKMRFVHRDVQIKAPTEASLLSNAVFTIGLRPQGPDETHRQSGWIDWIDIGVRSQLQREGWHGLALHADALEEQWTRIIAERPLGIAVSDATAHQTKIPFVHLLDEFRQAGLPVVVYGSEAESEGFDSVESDHFAGAGALTRHFVERGQTHIAMACGQSDTDYNWFHKRRAGYEAAMRAAGLQPLPPLILSHDNKYLDAAQFQRDIDGVTAGLGAWLERHPQTEVLHVVSDAFVPLLGEALKRLGKRPNHDVWLAGYDNYWRESPYHQITPIAPCATVDKKNYQCGVEMVRLLRARVDGELPTPAQHQLLEPELILLP